MKDLVSEAVRLAVSVERKCYDFYRKAAMTAPDPGDRQIFERLACEEAQHLAAMRGDDLGSCCESHPPYGHPDLERQLSEPQGRLLELLRLALLNKYFSIGLYTTFARSFREPSLCGIFEMALITARKELRSIRQLYLQDDPLSATSNFTRRPRRIHLRSSIPRVTTNKHTQPYFSLQDCGRNHG